MTRHPARQASRTPLPCGSSGLRETPRALVPAWRACHLRTRSGSFVAVLIHEASRSTRARGKGRSGEMTSAGGTGPAGNRGVEPTRRCEITRWPAFRSNALRVRISDLFQWIEKTVTIALPAEVRDIRESSPQGLRWGCAFARSSAASRCARPVIGTNKVGRSRFPASSLPSFLVK